MSEHGHEQGAGKTGGLPGANADPVTSESSADEVAEVLPADEAASGEQSSV